ncbi:heat shock protein HtpX [Ectothiorhodospira mobilis]|uniref:Protease HtpX n=1 Tax=Ectothiorhodospira mobilis TaxID=195064 RepID=A0A1I4Q6Y4_ECTMO|nr:protease HtpX [Ectothiorhodospira mobilis]SFM35829.1 heat shock protein HtpX [Ectothiorhodospira mobilis]
MKRIALFLATNLAIIVVLSITLRLLGVERILDESGTGLDYTSLLIFAAVFGFGGSFISLAISKWMAKMSMGVQVIEQPRSPDEQWLVETVRRQARQAGIGMPEVGIFNSPEPNAFATGMSRNNALVAVSTGLLQNMGRDEVEAVLGHEVSHVANGDMVTLALIQGVVNTFVIFLARVIGHVVDRVVFKNEEGHGPAFWITTIVAEIVLAILASIIVMWFSRRREFRADAGGAELAGREKMIHALERLRAAQGMPAQMPDQMRAFGIRGGGMAQGLKRLFMTHPPLEERIMALKAAG